MAHFWFGLLLFVCGAVMTAAGAISYSQAWSIGYARFDISGIILAALGAVAMVIGVAVWIVGYIKRRK